MLAVENKEKDLVILAYLQYRQYPHFLKSAKYARRNYNHFQIYGQNVCQKMFLFMHAISVDKFYIFVHHSYTEGLVSRMHGNTNRLPKNTHTLETNLFVRTFIEHYAEQNTVLLPGRIVGYKESRVCLLPSSESKNDVWLLYKKGCGLSKKPLVCFSSFCELWNKLLPWIILAKPMIGLCWKCQCNNNLIFKCSNQSEEKKVEN